MYFDTENETEQTSNKYRQSWPVILFGDHHRLRTGWSCCVGSASLLDKKPSSCFVGSAAFGDELLSDFSWISAATLLVSTDEAPTRETSTSVDDPSGTRMPSSTPDRNPVNAACY